MTCFRHVAGFGFTSDFTLQGECWSLCIRSLAYKARIRLSGPFFGFPISILKGVAESLLHNRIAFSHRRHRRLCHFFLFLTKSLASFKVSTSYLRHGFDNSFGAGCLTSCLALICTQHIENSTKHLNTTVNQQ